MNEPSNFDNGASGSIGCAANSTLNHPPFTPQFLTGDGSLFYKTVCPAASQHAGSHYNLHNMYGLTETVVTNAALKEVRRRSHQMKKEGATAKLRPFVISRSTFPGQGHFGGHWTGDVYSTWDSMKQSLPGR